jgi:hypothetical protein
LLSLRISSCDVRVDATVNDVEEEMMDDEEEMMDDEEQEEEKIQFILPEWTELSISQSTGSKP